MTACCGGDLPPGGKCDLKTLAAEAGVPRTDFYPKKNRDGTTRPGPYQHLGEEFERRLKAQRAADESLAPRPSQIEQLKAQVAELKERVAKTGRGAGRAHRIQDTYRLRSRPSTRRSSG